MKNLWIKSLVVLGLFLSLASCSSGGSCNGCNTSGGGSGGNITLSLKAPSQYPANQPVAITATLTITNTSGTDATNLVYTVPSATNYTGVTITPNPTGVTGYNCANIAAGASCQFTALIAAYAKPGSFTVLATPTVGGASILAKLESKIGIKADSISVTANLGLVDIPVTQNSFYILPSEQTITASVSGATTAYVSILVTNLASPFDSLKLVDETGTALTYSIVGSLSTSAYTVNTYSISIPAGKSVQHIQALSSLSGTNVCSTLNNGTNSDTACSNNALVNLAASGTGILQIQPSYFNMSESYTRQVVKLINIGNAGLTGIQLPTFASQFTVTDNNCTSGSLIAGAECTFVLIYTPDSISATPTYAISYNNGTQTTSSSITIPYIGSAPAGAQITASPTVIHLSESNTQQAIVLTNTGGATATGLTMPTLSLPLFPVGATTCSATLLVGESCVYTIAYNSATTASSAILTFTYIGGTVPVPVSWSRLVQYGYVINDDGSNRHVYKCNVSESGVLIGCAISNPVSGLTGQIYGGIAIATFGGVKYVYVTQSSGLIDKCTFTSNGDLDVCSNAITDSSDCGGDIRNMAFATVNGNTYAYFADDDADEIHNALVGSNGDLTGCTDNSVSGNAFNIAFTTVNGTQYAYASPAASSEYVKRYTLNASTGVLENGTDATGFVDSAYAVAFATFAGQQYAYMGTSDSLFQCNLDESGLFTGCASTPSSGAPLWGPQGITFNVTNGLPYIYTSTGAVGVYSCSVSTSTGQLNVCTQNDSAILANSANVQFTSFAQ